MFLLRTSGAKKLNPVVELVHSRKAKGSRPGHRDDGRCLALAVEGGAMRGVVSAGMVAALENLGLRDTFDLVVGASAGAISGAYFVARQARLGTTIFYDDINNSSFINLSRPLSRKPIVSLEFLLDNICVDVKPLDRNAILQSDIPLHVVVTDANTGRRDVLSNFSREDEVTSALRASARIPWVAGPPVQIADRAYVDASVSESIPFATAFDLGATDVLVLLTRPFGNLRSEVNLLDKGVVAPHLAKHSEALKNAYLRRADVYRHEMTAMAAFAEASDGRNLLPVQIPSDSPKVSSLERSRDRLVAGAMAGYRATYGALQVECSQLAEIITPTADLV